MRKWLKVIRYVLICTLASIASYVFLFPQLFSCQIIAFSGFREIETRIFLSPGYPLTAEKKLVKIIRSAEHRVDSLFGGRRSRPRMIICDDPKEYQKYCNGSEGAGCSIGAPWGESFVVVNGQGINPDVIAHEMCHIELMTRIGWWRTYRTVPQWFNEGLAMMLDHRFVSETHPVARYFAYYDEWQYYSGGGQIIRELNTLSSIGDFFSGDQRSVMTAYMTSGMEVSYWMALIGEKGFQRFLTEVDDGVAFDQAYAENEPPAGQRNGLPINPLRTGRKLRK